MEKTNTKELKDNQYLTFYLKGEIFGVEVLYVKEIIEYIIITKVPLMQEFLLGVTNIRGNVISVIDLANRLGIGKSEITKRTSIIITEVNINEEIFNIGLLVDSVNQVVEIEGKNIETAPMFGAKIRKEFIKKMGKIDDKFITIINADEVLELEEVSIAQELKRSF